MKHYIEQLKYRTPRIPLPELTEEERALRLTEVEAVDMKVDCEVCSSMRIQQRYMAFGGKSARASNAPTRPGQPNRPNRHS